MKKIFVVLIIITFAFGAISCSKTCICKGTETREIAGSVNPPEKRNVNMDVGKKSKSECEAFIYEPTEKESIITVTHDVVCRPEE